jgi:hypothetical protein
LIDSLASDSSEKDDAGTMPTRVLAFGACTIHDPIKTLADRQLVRPVWLDTGATTLYAASMGEYKQQFHFLRGERPLPQLVFRLCSDYVAFRPDEKSRQAVDSAEVILIEVSSPIEIRLGDYFVNRDRVASEVTVPLQKHPDGEVAEAARRWLHDGILRANEASRAASARIMLDARPLGLIDEEMEYVVEHLRSRQQSADEVERSILELVELAGKPVGLAAQSGTYMPDGRPISWPQGFRQMAHDIARRHEIPMLDPAAFVQDYGFDRAIRDHTHFTREFEDFLAERYGAFIQGIVCGPVPHPSRG